MSGFRPPKRQPFRKGSLRGFASFTVPITKDGDGIVLHDFPVLKSHGKCWCSLPSKPRIEYGRHKLGDNGDPLYSPSAEFTNRQLQDRFSAAAIDLVAAADPHALKAGA
jgi:hypothetical protein